MNILLYHNTYSTLREQDIKKVALGKSKGAALDA